MKHWKRLVTFIAVAAMALAMGVGTAWAEPAANTIKVDGLKAGDTVKYVQVIKWDETQGWVKAPGFESLSDEVFNEVVGTATVPGKIDDASATAIAALASTMTDGGAVAADSTSWEKEGLAPGLYMVQPVATTADVIYNPLFLAVQSDGAGSELTLPLNYDDEGTAKQSTVTLDKTAKSQDSDQWGEATTEDVGDIIDYKVVTTVPAYLESWTSPVFTVTDELSDGLTFAVGEDGSLTTLTLKAGDTTLVEGTDYTITQLTASKWVVSFTDAYLKGRTTATAVTITYQVKITDDAKNVNPELNTVTIDYSRNPSDSSDHGTMQDKTTHYTFDIDAGLQGDTEYTTSEIIKVDADGTTQEVTYSNGTEHHPLAGAVFKIYKDAECTQPYTNSTITAETTFTTTEQGLINIKGLDEGTYYLKETVAPSGYMLITDKLKFVISATYTTVPATETCNSYQELKSYSVAVSLVHADGSVTDTGTSSYTLDNGTVVKNSEGHAGDVSTEVVNTKGQSLPSTGGMGTTILYIIGGIMVLLAVVFLITKKRVAATRKETSDDIL